jgi:filamentous hemagglutinin family protein
MGSNLFHSFSDFSLPWSPFGAAARFENNNAAVTKIISRVTGINPSNIDGILQSGGPNPNFDLILINPNGITFGPNANLALNGSFLASTAQSVTFADNSQFNANPAAPSTLTMSAPVAYNSVQMPPSSPSNPKPTSSPIYS